MLNKNYKQPVIYLIVILFILFSVGCSSLKKVDTANKSHNIKNAKNTSNRSNKKSSSSENKNAKIYSLGKIQRSELWEYQPTKVRKVSSITNDLGVVHTAGTGRQYVLIFFKMKNISDIAAAPLVTYDPEPVILAGSKTYEYEDNKVNQLKTSEQFSEEFELKTGQSQTGWLLFVLPTSKTNLKLRIEGLYWKL